MGALDFGVAGNTSLILSRETSQAIKASSTPLSFTLEAWVWVADPALRRPQPLFTRYPRLAPVQGDSQAEFLLQLQGNGNLNLFFGGGDQNPNRVALNLNCGFDVVPANRWTHIALTVSTPPVRVNPNDVRVYANGQLACQWPNSSNPMGFNGTRQVMHDQPFAFSNYQSNGQCEGQVQTFSGRMDEIRVWAGVRTAAQILGSYTTVTSSSSPGLVGQFSLDRLPAEEAGGYALDASTTGANAAFYGVDGARPQWIPSTAPIEPVLVETANFQLTPITLYGYATNYADSWSAQVNMSSLRNGTEFLYLDAAGSVFLAPSDQITALTGNK